MKSHGYINPSISEPTPIPYNFGLTEYIERPPFKPITFKESIGLNVVIYLGCNFDVIVTFVINNVYISDIVYIGLI